MTEPCKKGYQSPRWSGEVADCSMPLTFDTYDNCSFGCVYCFSQYQRGVGSGKEDYLAKQVRSVNPQRVRDIFTLKKESQFSEYIRQRRTIQWGGLSDQFDGYERKHGVTLELLKLFKELDYPISFSTKSTWWLQDKRYTDLFKGQKNWNCKFSIITADPEMAAKIERGVATPQERIDAIRRFSELDAGGATLRLRPFIIGVSSKTYKTLIREAAAAGATAMTTEFFCLERRSVRLNRAIKEPYVRKMRDLCHEVGMRFYVSDAHFKEACDNACCCGLPDDWKISRCQFSEALQLCRRNGRVTFSEIGGDADFLEFPWSAAEGFNTGGVERRAKFAGMTMRDYLRWLWNNPKAGQSPYAMFEGVMLPDGLDEHGDVIYRWNQSRTFVEGGE